MLYECEYEAVSKLNGERIIIYGDSWTQALEAHSLKASEWRCAQTEEIEDLGY